MFSQAGSAFALPSNLSAKADQSLISDDEQHFALVAETLRRTDAELSERLEAERRAPGRHGQAALERDQQIHRLTSRLRALRRFGLDVCLGRMVSAAETDDDGAPVYVGRLGLTDSTGRRLLIDWRSPAAAPFFGATHANPMGLVSRRRYRWSGGLITDYWDEVFTGEGLRNTAVALDDQSAFIASLAGSRSERMRDVLGTIQADQDAIIRAGSRGPLVVDGGPGTGKTVVALHRTAYLLYSDPRFGHNGAHKRNGVLFLGPHQPYLAYVADVLPSLGEDGVRTCTLSDLLPEGAAATPEPDAVVARLKSSVKMVNAVDRAVGYYEEPPTDAMTVETPWADLELTAEDWAEAFDAVEPGTPHNEAREQIWDAMLTILTDKHDDDATPEAVRSALATNRTLRAALNRAWPMLEAKDVISDLWSVPAYLRICAPWLNREEIQHLQRGEPSAWTVADLPLLDAARRRLGDAEAGRRRRRYEVAVAAEEAHLTQVVEGLIQADDGEGLVTMLRHPDLQRNLVDVGALPDVDPDALAGPFGHIVVDEAQELTDAQWQMLLSRCPSRSFTIVGDRAQARRGFKESWQERLARVVLPEARVASLTINYRTPEEVMAEAEPMIRVAVPDANVPTSVRTSGVPVMHGALSELEVILERWLGANDDGVACVIGCSEFEGSARVRLLTSELAKGLEFDLVVLVDPESFGDGIEGAVDRYVAMTRATRELVILRSEPAR